MGILAGCDNTPVETNDGFDRPAFLAFMADAQIVPAYEAAADALGNLETAILAFTTNPDGATLAQAQEQWLLANLAWQDAQMFNFGPAENSFGTLAEDLGTFPADTTRIEQLIAAGDTSLANFDRDTRGFAGADYLLHQGEEAYRLAGFQQDPLRRAYLRAVTRDLRERLQNVLDEWSSYRSEFIANDGSDAGSSVSLLYNNFVGSFEALKNFKVGLPAGKRPGQVAAEPNLVEAPYSGTSLPLLIRHFERVVDLWEGIPMAGNTRLGWRDYLESVVGGDALIAATREQIQAVETAIAAMPFESLSQAIENEAPQVEALHTELQKLTRFFKSDMSSLLGISITYDSGDGD